MRVFRGVPLAIAGDVLVLIGFAAVGRASHDDGHGNALVEASVVAAPFIAGWLVVATLLGGFAPSTIHDRARTVRRIPAIWIAGGLLGIILRALVQQRPVPPAFDAIALGFNLITLTSWRVILAFLAVRS